MKTDDLREAYLQFFASKGCVRRPSDVLVPTWDPSVLFTPAGMNQFKDHFLGRVKLEYTKATTCQKCLRTGDIENVGRTAYHHTFFEMLGNFSFGDYFKREAIHWAWEFLTSPKWLKLEPDRLSITVYLDDDEAYNIWANEIKVPGARISRCGEDENFWPASAPSQGPDGVCGPCSEIYYTPPGSAPVEIWNLVFTQFNRVGAPPDNLKPLPKKNIDTGMGLERTAASLQGVTTNYHIDTLRPIVEAAAQVCKVKYEPDSDSGRRLRRITDHVRACAFAIHENVYPGPKEAKYVIRRLMRRAALDGWQMGVREPFLGKLVQAVADSAKVPYPELQGTVGRVAQVMEQEEGEFLGKIDAGLSRIEKLFAQVPAKGEIPGGQAAELYQTYGFPPELVASMGADRSLSFDWAGYQKAMDEHGKISDKRSGAKLFGDEGPLGELVKQGLSSEFVGYESTSAPGKVIGILNGANFEKSWGDTAHKEPITVVLDRTPFYGESGGQVGDRGELTASGVRFEVTDTQRDRGFVLHTGVLKSGALAIGQQVEAKVDVSRRTGIRRAHSATHLLHHALQHNLGGHAQQQGSKVDDDWLRFDFTHLKAVTAEELEKIESEVNERVRECATVSWRSLPIAEARQTGAMMLFGEKYPDIVRMVEIGQFSKELCGGTHLDNSGEVGLFRIVGEESVSAGTRRITALTGKGALNQVRQSERTLHQVAHELKAPVAELAPRVAALAKEVRELKKQLQAGAVSKAASPEELLAGAEKIGDVKLVAASMPDVPVEQLRDLIDQLRRKGGSIAIVLGSAQGPDKVMLMSALSKDLVERGLDAKQLISEAAKLVGGGGGGRAEMAQAGGKQPQHLPAALQKASEAIREKLAAR